MRNLHFIKTGYFSRSYQSAVVYKYLVFQIFVASLVLHSLGAFKNTKSYQIAGKVFISKSIRGWLLKYGFCKKSLRKNETLTSWTLNWSEFHFSEVTSYKIHTLASMQVVIIQSSMIFKMLLFKGQCSCMYFFVCKKKLVSKLVLFTVVL